ncbi:hypothetical protein L596_027443 [Steinernema carpocapsae]|uniref:C-type lectin domain-containing protein n=1 Tax=Steinernema carpocapsae TaxID=34508 RepID=A0A4U5M4E1_STECR|nr:hypothetical protein L596_027443 [Steinernema carpocapsae]
MRPAGLHFLMLSFLVLVILNHCSKIHYTQISGPVPWNYHTRDVFEVASEQECVKMAFRNNFAVGFVHKNETKMQCELVDYIWTNNCEGDVPDVPVGTSFFMADLRGLSTCSVEKTRMIDIMTNITMCHENAEICRDLKNLEARCSDNFTCTDPCPDTIVGFNRVANTCLFRSDFKELHEWPVNEIFHLCEAPATPIIITSEKENNEIAEIFSDNNFVIGLYLPDDAVWDEKNFKWASGSTSTYRNWAPEYPKKEKGTMVALYGSKAADGFAGKWINVDIIVGNKLLEEMANVCSACSVTRTSSTDMQQHAAPKKPRMSHEPGSNLKVQQQFFIVIVDGILSDLSKCEPHPRTCKELDDLETSYNALNATTTKKQSCPVKKGYYEISKRCVYIGEIYVFAKCPPGYKPMTTESKKENIKIANIANPVFEKEEAVFNRDSWAARVRC